MVTKVTSDTNVNYLIINLQKQSFNAKHFIYIIHKTIYSTKKNEQKES